MFGANQSMGMITDTKAIYLGRPLQTNREETLWQQHMDQEAITR